MHKINRRLRNAPATSTTSHGHVRVGGTIELQRRHRTVTVHRYQEIIGGRAYFIEVTHASNRWRAQLMRAPGVPTAMMPFYGPTPDEAAKQLTQWLTLAHRRVAPAAVGVAPT